MANSLMQRNNGVQVHGKVSIGLWMLEQIKVDDGLSTHTIGIFFNNTDKIQY